ncbi:MAG: AmmeMemoRadiSam system protein B [Gammaproteobacteria bacterium]
MDIRQPAVAGQFYPADPGTLRRVVRQCLEGARPAAPARVLVAPHAGYVYSGAVAACAYATLAAARGSINRVLLLGPCHRTYITGLALPAAEAFRTPLGDVALDRPGMQVVAACRQVCVSQAAHALEHSLEVQLPFLQEALGDFSLVPLAVGAATPAEVAGVIALLWDAPGTLTVISTDLSHYHDYATARRIDARTTRAIESFDTAAIGPEQACGYVPLNGLLTLAQDRCMKVTTLCVANSGDTAGPRDRVVGYGAWAVC